MKKYLALAFLLFVPFLTNAQQAPELYITNLSIEKTNYQLGETITGSFTLHNASDFDVSNIYYDVTLGEVSEKGSSLVSKIDSSESLGSKYLYANSKEEISFSYKPSLTTDGDLGIRLNLKRENGKTLTWAVKPLVLEGEKSEILRGLFYVPGGPDESFNYFSLDSGPRVSEDEEFYLLLNSESTEDEVDVQVDIYEKFYDKEPIYSNLLPTTKIEVEDQEVFAVSLPKEFEPGTYIGKAKMDGTTSLEFRYAIAGVQAEILSVNSTKLQLQKGEKFEVDVFYVGALADKEDLDKETASQNIKFDLRITNELGKEVASYFKVTDVQLIKDELGEFNKEFNELISLVSSTKANQLSFNLKVYDEDAGELLDEYQTTFPVQESQSYNLITIKNIFILVAGLIVVFGLLFLLKIRHKIPTVCLMILFSLIIAGGSSYQGDEISAAELIVNEEGRLWTNGELQVISPVSYEVGTYQTGSTVDLLANYNTAMDPDQPQSNAMMWPASNKWHDFSSAQEAADHIIANSFTNSQILNLFISSRFLWVALAFSPIGQIDLSQFSISNDNYKLSISGPFGSDTDIADDVIMPDEPGTYYIPLRFARCGTSSVTAGRGSTWCMDYKTFAQEIRVADDACLYFNGEPDSDFQSEIPEGYEDLNGDGNCTTKGGPTEVGDPTDLCHYIDGESDYLEIQTTIPSHLEDPDGDKNCTTKGDPEDLCHFINGEPDPDVQTIIPSHLEDSDGDKNCTTKGDPEDPEDPEDPGDPGDPGDPEAPVLSVSCSPSESDFTVSNSISGETQTTFSANVVGATSAVTYKWEDESGSVVSTGSTYLFDGNEKSVGTYKYKVTVTDQESNSATSPLCSINVTPDGTNDVPTINSLNINPVVEPCEITFDASGVDSCTIGGKTYNDSNSDSLIDRTEEFNSGTYYLTCSGNGIEVTGGPVICISNPDVIER